MDKKRIVLIVLTILWMVVIFCFSAENADESSSTSGNTIRAVVRIFANLDEEMENQVVEQLQHMVRKMAHFSIYTIGGIILINLVRTYTKKNKAWLYAWGIGTIYAATDELHQYFVPGRSCQITDVILDSAGVVTGILIVVLVIYIKEKISKKYLHFF